MARRSWHRAHAEPVAGGWQVWLDATPVRLPSGDPLVLRGGALAAAVAAEWDRAGAERGGSYTPHDTKLTALAATAQQRIAAARDATVEALARYGATDLLCYRAATPSGLVQRQQAIWQPWLEWVATRHGARLVVTAGVTHVPQPPDGVAALRRTLHERTDEALAGLGLAVPALGSLVLGLALADRALTAAAAFEASVLDEMYQHDHWGLDHEAAARHRRLHDDVALAARFMELSRDEGTP